jgi:tripartite-type tricarboxylate transporter receptor subunit TctC
VSADLAKVVSDPDIRRRLAQLGSYSHPMSPTEVTAFVQEQQRTWKPALRNIAEAVRKRRERAARRPPDTPERPPNAA